MNKQISSALSQGNQTKVVLKVEGKQQFMGKEIPVVTGGFGEDNKVVTDKMVAEIHNITTSDARKAINRNIKRFKANIDVIDLKSSSPNDDLILQLGYSKQQVLQAEHIYLLSERGYSKLIKIMDTDLAWEIHDKLIDDYFITREKRAELQNLSPQLQLLINMELEQKKMQEQLVQVNHHALEATATAVQAKQEVQAIREAITLDPVEWRTKTTSLVVKIAQKFGGNEYIHDVRKESYQLLETIGKAQLSIRLTNMRRKILEETGSKSKAEKVSKLDVIASDARLKEIYIGIISKMAIKYGVA